MAKNFLKLFVTPLKSIGYLSLTRMGLAPLTESSYTDGSSEKERVNIAIVANPTRLLLLSGVSEIVHQEYDSFTIVTSYFSDDPRWGKLRFVWGL